MTKRRYKPRLRLKKLVRDRLGLNLYQFSIRAIGPDGRTVPVQLMYAWAKGTKTPTMKHQFWLCDAIGCNLSELWTRQGPEIQ